MKKSILFVLFFVMVPAYGWGENAKKEKQGEQRLSGTELLVKKVSDNALCVNDFAQIGFMLVSMGQVRRAYNVNSMAATTGYACQAFSHLVTLADCFVNDEQKIYKMDNDFTPRTDAEKAYCLTMGVLNIGASLNSIAAIDNIEEDRFFSTLTVQPLSGIQATAKARFYTLALLRAYEKK